MDIFSRSFGNIMIDEHYLTEEYGCVEEAENYEERINSLPGPYCRFNVLIWRNKGHIGGLIFMCFVCFHSVAM